MLARRHGPESHYIDPNGKANVVFLDGHAEPLTFGEIVAKFALVKTQVGF